jgi:hypothetical protein
MTLSTFPTFPTFLTFGLVRAGWLKFVITKTGGHAIHRRAGQRAAFFRGTYARKVRKARKVVPVMTLRTFPTFLTFLTQRLRLLGTWKSFPAGPLERHESLGPLTGTPPRRRPHGS